MQYIKLGSVGAFPHVAPTKPQALKVLEEAAGVFGAWQHTPVGALDPTMCEDRSMERYATPLIDEIADTIQASCNLAAALGVTDLTPYLARCEERNRKRGRYDG